MLIETYCFSLNEFARSFYEIIPNVEMNLSFHVVWPTNVSPRIASRHSIAVKLVALERNAHRVRSNAPGSKLTIRNHDRSIGDAVKAIADSGGGRRLT